MPARSIPPARSYEPALINAVAEASLLGALLSTNRHAEWMVDAVQAEDFHDELHREIYRAAVERIDSGKTASPVTLMPLFSAEASPYLAGLTASDSTFYAVREHAEIVADLGKRRRMVDALAGAMQSLNRPGEARVEDICGTVDTAMSALASVDEFQVDWTMGQAVREALQRAEDEGRGVQPELITCATLPDWNKLVRMRPGNLIVLAGRPGMGKTTVGLNIAVGCAMNDHGAQFISLEMDATDLALKAVADLSYEHGVSASFDNIEAGRLNREDWRRLKEAEDRLAALPFEIHTPGAMRIGRLRAVIRRCQRKMAAKGKALKLVVVDYLQLIEPDRLVGNRTVEVGEIVRGLKRLARELGIVLIALAQPNRECEKRDNKRPFMPDLRDSGEIEQAADVVAFLYREEYYQRRAEPDPDDPKHEAWQTLLRACTNKIEIYTDKVRKGAGGKAICWFFGFAQAVRGSNFLDDRRMV